ncbi:hypothetical protein GCM10009557_58740 [Virgisporangium ochraceum]
MSDELRDRVMRGLSTVEWQDARTIRRRAGRRRARQVVAGCVAVVAAIAVVWTAAPFVRHEGASPRPADPTADGTLPALNDTRLGYGMMRAEDFGPGFEVNAWGSHDTTEGGQDADERVLEWPSTWLTGCPAYAAAPPAGCRGHRGGLNVRADPMAANAAAPVQEFVMRFADEAAAGAVLDEARQIATRCASFDVAGRYRYTVTVAAEDFVGDDAVRLDLTGVGTEHATGGQVGVPGLEVYVLIRVGSAVIMLLSTGSVDAAWLQGLAPTAVGRLCGESVVC